MGGGSEYVTLQAIRIPTTNKSLADPSCHDKVPDDKVCLPLSRGGPLLISGFVCPRQYMVVYCIMLLLGAGLLFPYNVLITAVDYFRRLVRLRALQ